MNHTVTLTLPLSATALQEGADFLARLSTLAEVIHKETLTAGQPVITNTFGYHVDLDPSAAETVAPATDLAIAESATVLQPAPIEYEDVFVGYVRNDSYTGELAAFDHEALTAAGWTDEALLQKDYLYGVTEKRPKPCAPGASAVSAPAPPAPAPGAPSTSATDSSVTDKDGIVWDARIHSDATEKLSKEGFWKRKRNVPDELWNSVRAELGVAPAAPATPPAPPAPNASVSPTPPPPAAPGADQFREFTQWIMPLMKDGKLDETKNILAIQKAGLTKLVDLAKSPEFIAAVKADLIATYGLTA